MEINREFIEANPELDSRLASVADIIDRNPLCTLATLDWAGAPHASAVYYSADAYLNIFFLTPPTTRHSRNVALKPNIAVTIFDSRQSWGQPHIGLQAFGHCHLVGEKEQEWAFRTYARRFPDLLTLASTTEDLIAHLQSRFYVMAVSRLDLIDELRYGSESRFSIPIYRAPGCDAAESMTNKKN